MNIQKHSRINLELINTQYVRPSTRYLRKPDSVSSMMIKGKRREPTQNEPVKKKTVVTESGLQRKMAHLVKKGMINNMAKAACSKKNACTFLSYAENSVSNLKFREKGSTKDIKYMNQASTFNKNTMGESHSSSKAKFIQWNKERQVTQSSAILGANQSCPTKESIY